MDLRYRAVGGMGGGRGRAGGVPVVVVPRRGHPRASPSARVAAPFRAPRIRLRARRANLRFLQEQENEERFSRAPRVRIPSRRIRMSASLRFGFSSLPARFSFHFIHVRRREAKERRSVAVSSAAHGATLTARRRRRTRSPRSSRRFNKNLSLNRGQLMNARTARPRWSYSSKSLTFASYGFAPSSRSTRMGLNASVARNAA